jgi:limonene-1,2-epoxide hydrolase
MKRSFGFAISIAVVLFLIHTGNIGNSSIYAASNGKDVIKQLFDGWSSQNPDQVAAAFTEDGVYEDVTAGHISRGRAEVRKWAEGGFMVVENFKMELISNYVRNGHGVAEWVWSGTDKGLLNTGKKFSVRGVSVYEVRRGKISRYKEFYDFATVMRQVGVLPAEKE